MGTASKKSDKMHDILIATHMKENIDILKARDYYFDKARKQNNTFRKLCLLTPILISIIGMFVGTIFDFSDTDEWLDILVGIAAITAFAFDLYLQKSIDDNMEKSNILREEYDCKVLGIKKNGFYGNNSEEEIDELKKVSRLVPDMSKYEVWYRETFSKAKDDNFSNAICLAMDNTIYTYHIYKDFKRQIRNQMILLGVGFLLYLAWFEFTPDDYYVAMVTPFLLFVSLFDVVKELIESYIVSRDLEKSNEKLIKYVKTNAKEILSKKSERDILLRSLEDIVYNNRAKSMFIPRKTRNKFLKNGNPYYRDLDEIKNLYWKEKDLVKPESSEDFLIPCPERENKNMSMSEIHKELIEMLKDIKSIIGGEVEFLLDGGTLLGAKRDGNTFLPWDDDVDISIKSTDADKLKEIFENQDKYVIQDYYSEEYYSPRLSRLRIRKKDTQYIVDEKDSELYPLYDNRGLFIDVYAYSPIFVNRFFDYVYRMIFFSRLHKRIRKAEKEWKTKDSDPRALDEFKRLKGIYKKRRKDYLEYVHCDDYYAYEPCYMEPGLKIKGWLGKVVNDHETLKDFFANQVNPAIYIKKEALYGNEDSDTRAFKESVFVDESFGVPLDENEVLSAYYGGNWIKSPYKRIDDLKDYESNEFIRYSADTFDASNYKHIKAVHDLSVKNEKAK